MDPYEEIAHLKRQMGSLINIGTVVEVDSSKALARVQIGDRVTDFLPVSMTANSFMKAWIPPTVGQQVTVLSGGGDASFGVIMGSIYASSCAEPAGAGGGVAVVQIGGVRIECDGSSVKITGNLELVGDLGVEGSIGSTEDITSSKKVIDQKGSITDRT